MGRRRYVRNKAKIRAWLKAGRGRGTGKYYFPFLTVRDVPSHGRSHRVYSWISQRVLHLLSDLEYSFFLLFEFQENVDDIREQYRLPLASTLRIAKKLGIAHPRVPGTNDWAIMTTDLVVTYKGPTGKTIEANYIKYEKDLDDPRVEEKRLIEKQYWEELGHKFNTRDETEIPLWLRLSLDWLLGYRSLENFKEWYPGQFQRLAENLMDGLLVAPSDQPLSELCIELDEGNGEQLGMHLLLARHMLATGVLVTDLNVHRLAFQPVGDIAVNGVAFQITLEV